MTNLPQIIDLTKADKFPETLFQRAEADAADLTETVRAIVEDVKSRGDDALIDFARKFDGVTAKSFSIDVKPEEFDVAFRMLPQQLIEDIAFAADNIRRFHEAQRPEEMWMKEMHPGAWAGDRFVPMDTVCCYIPRGKGSFPSVVNMTAIPGLVAGVRRLIITTPPGPDGTIDAATLVAAKLIGVTEIFKCGGAQGVAAVAYGTQTVPKADKILGPGSSWVIEAKRQLANRIDPGVPAGPSEVIILADSSANPALAGMDVIIESEHGPDSSAYLVTDSSEVAHEAQKAIAEHWKGMGEKRAGFSRTVLTGPRGGIVLVKDFDAAVAFTNRYAPEHLQILTRDPMEVLGRITDAGEVLLGDYTPTTLGNYVLGPNAVLPTGGGARTASPLSVFDFMKRISVGHVTAKGYECMAGPAYRLATYEGFDGHARAVSPLRLEIINSAVRQ